MSISEYNKKRNFKATSEPKGKVEKLNTNRFVIQYHQARAKHYDFRLEHNGVLLSWAVPKGLSTNPKDKRLAVHVEDHPVDYINFEGIIPNVERRYRESTSDYAKEEIALFKSKTLTDEDLKKDNIIFVMNEYLKTAIAERGRHHNVFLLGNTDIPDPFGQQVEDYQFVKNMIEQAIDKELLRLENLR